jgi:hypothetical protein
MHCTLMHKHAPVLDMIIDEATGRIAKLGRAHAAEHLPVGIQAGKSGIDRAQLNEWWVGRSIPASRYGLQEALEKLGMPSPAVLVSKCYGLSLSDQYWICPKDSGLIWNAVNFFTNDFSRDVGEILFGHDAADRRRISLMSPDNTSDGWLRKKWVIRNGKRYLMKGGSGVFQQEPFNEVIASALMRRLGIAHAPYTLAMEGGKPFCLCENFITPQTELIPADRIRRTRKQASSDSDLTHFLRCCDALGISGARAFLDRLLAIDFIIMNEDRHYNNFGAVRNAETLEWLGMAPVYDSGTSLWHETLRVGSHLACKPFRKDHAEQIKLVSDLSWYNHDALDGFKEEIVGIFEGSAEVNAERRAQIGEAVMGRAGEIGVL